MNKKIKKEDLIYGIVGAGRFGYALAVELADYGAELLVIDKDEDKIRELREFTENAFVVKSLDKKSLAETGIQNCNVAVVCIGEHIDTSVLTTLNLVSLGIPTVIAKATSIEHGEILEKLGAEVVYPEHDMAVRLATRLENSRMLDFVQLSEKINITKFILPVSFIGKTVLETDIRSRFGLNIIAVENQNTVLNGIGPDYIFRANDILYISGSKENIYNITEWVDSIEKSQHK